MQPASQTPAPASPDQVHTVGHYLLIWLKGVFMGAVELIPGVSAGTIALITGILPSLLASLRNINFTAIALLRREGFKAAWHYFNGNFLLVLVLGLFSGFGLLLHLITYTLSHFPIHIWSFFFGLILASAIWLASEIEGWYRLDSLLLFFAGALLAYYITLVSPVEIQLSGWIVFVAGLVAICAMVLPGLSGSFLLMLVGLYVPILNALKNLQWDIIVLFMCGASIGILVFSHVLSFLFERFPRQTYALLTGVMLGSLNKIWPWKEVLVYRVNSQGENVPFLSQSVSPAYFESISQSSAQVPWSLACFAAGLLLVLFSTQFKKWFMKSHSGS